MAANKHLNWFEIKEFGGLWTAGEQSLMPANNAQVMSGCHPQVGGGLRSFLKVTETVPGTGLNLTKLTLPGLGTAYAHTPDSFLPSGLGELDVRIHLALTDWTPAAFSVAIGDLDAAGFKGWELGVVTDGRLQFAWGDGAAIQIAVSTISARTAAYGVPANGVDMWLRVVFNANVSGVQRETKFYASVDGTLWDQVGTTVVGATTTVSASAQQLRIGVRPDGTLPLAGTVYRAEGWTVAPPGTSVPKFNIDFTAQDVADTSFTDRVGNTWTIAGTAAIDDQSATLQQAVGFGVSLKASTAESKPLFYLVTVDDPGGLADNWRIFSYDAPNDPIVRWWPYTGMYEGQSYGGSSPTPSTPTFGRIFVSPYSKDVIGLSIRESFGLPSRLGSGVYHLRYDRYAVQLYEPGGAAVASLYGASTLVEHQSRLVIGFKDMIRFTNPETLDFGIPADRFVRLNPQGWEVEDGLAVDTVHEGPLVAWMVSVPPGDLIVATRDGRIYNVQGDLDDPTVRELGRWTTMLPHEPASTPNGIYFILPNQGVHRLGLDGAVENISADILPAVWNLVEPKVGLGQLAGTERFLFAPNQHAGASHKNGALVYDHDTRAWFTSTHADDFTITNPRLMQADNNPNDSGIWIATSQPLAGTATPAVLWHIRTGGGATSLTTEGRNSTWEWKSSPLRDPDGRQVIIREVQVPVHAFNAATSTIAVTVGGTTITRTLDAGRSIEVFQFRKRGENLDVTIKAKSNDTAVEAPMIEAVRVGWRSGPMI